MNDSRRTKAWLLEELARLRSEIASLKGHGGHDPCPAPPPAGLAEEVLRQSESNYRAVFNSVNDILFVHDIETGDAVDFNQRASEVFGFGPGEIDLLNAHFRREADPPYSYEDQMRWLRKTAEGPPQVFEWLAGDRNGRRFWVEVSVRRATIGARDRLLQQKPQCDVFHRPKDRNQRPQQQRAEGYSRRIGLHPPLGAPFPVQLCQPVFDLVRVARVVRDAARKLAFAARLDLGGPALPRCFDGVPVRDHGWLLHASWCRSRDPRARRFSNRALNRV